MSVDFRPDFGSYKKIPNFRYWVQSVLPQVYDDSLSYQELLQKVVVFLNNVIENEEVMEENLAKLLLAYEELQSYVNLYFENLDISAEIDRKLDNMAATGVLSELLSPFIPPIVTSWLNQNVEPVGSAVMVDKSLTIEGAAADSKITGDKTDLLAENIRRYNNANMALFGTFADSDYLGVNFTWEDGNTKCVVNGTSTDYAWNRFFYSADSLMGFEAGEEYFFNVHSSKPNNLYITIFYYINGVLDANHPVYVPDPRYITIPQNATGILMRVGCSSGVTFTNDYITIEIMNEISPILKPTGNAADRGQDILKRIELYGYCQLEKGEFYIGNLVDLPANCSILGRGKETVIKKTIGDTYSIFRVKDTKHNVTFRDLYFKGTNTEMPSSAPAVDNCAIIVQDNAGFITIDNCTFDGMERCGVFVSSGFSWARSVDVTNCYFIRCGKGAELSIGGEFAHFTNCHFIDCYYGALDQGGNNIFANCGFDGNFIGLFLYDTVPNTNNGHGSAVGCTFNHNETVGQQTDRRGIRAINISNGFLFSACHIFYGGVRITNSQAIMFDNCMMRGGARTPVGVTDCEGLVSLNGCVFFDTPTFDISNSPHFKKINCFMRDGNAVL